MLQRYTTGITTILSKHRTYLIITIFAISPWIVHNLHMNHVKITKTNVVFDADLLDHVSKEKPGGSLILLPYEYNTCL